MANKKDLQSLKDLLSRQQSLNENLVDCLEIKQQILYRQRHDKSAESVIATVASGAALRPVSKLNPLLPPMSTSQPNIGFTLDANIAIDLYLISIIEGLIHRLQNQKDYTERNNIGLVGRIDSTDWVMIGRTDPEQILRSDWEAEKALLQARHRAINRKKQQFVAESRKLIEKIMADGRLGSVVEKQIGSLMPGWVHNCIQNLAKGTEELAFEEWEPPEDEQYDANGMRLPGFGDDRDEMERRRLELH